MTSVLVPPSLMMPAVTLGASATAERSPPRKSLDSLAPPAERLLDDATQFDFFQAVWLLERMAPQRRPVGRDGVPGGEIVRFRAHQSLSFPPSSVFEIQPPREPSGPPRMTVTFMGLSGASGVLPRHYTELLLRLEREAKGGEKHALRDWLDLFNHRLISLFFRAWEKYRFYAPFARGEPERPEPDAFTTALRSLIGLGQPSLRHRLRVSTWRDEEEQTLGSVDDLGVLRYAGLLSQRPRTARNLEQLLADYFAVPVRVGQFQGEWLKLELAQQTRVGLAEGNCRLGSSAVVGLRVWDVQGKIRLRLGPLSYSQFDEFLPGRQRSGERKAQFLLAHLVRLYAGPEIDFDVQLVLKSSDVPQCRLSCEPDTGPRLGWNTWLLSQGATRDTDDALFTGQPLRWLK
jgi:type VI secretion system protein ImpH